MKLNNLRKIQEVIFNRFGIITENKPYELQVEQLISLYEVAKEECKKNEQDRYKTEIKRLTTQKTN